MAKITVSFMRKLEQLLSREEITYSRMVELLNEKAAKDEDEKGKWAGGLVECAICTHSWAAVRPAETKNLECPNCGNFSEVIEH